MLVSNVWFFDARYISLPTDQPQRRMNERLEKMNERNEKAARVARTAGPSFLTNLWGGWLAIGLAAGVLFSVIGPTQSYDYPIWFRLAFWLPLCVIASQIGAVIEKLARGRSWSRSTPVLWFVLTAALAAAMTPIVYAANSIDGWEPLGSLLPYAGNSIVFSATFAAVRLLSKTLLKNQDLAARDSNGAARSGQPDFFALLPPSLQGSKLKALSAEGHYVRVWTEAGSELLLLRFKDAVRQLDRKEGTQVHRSWWVRKNSINSVHRRDGRIFLNVDGVAQVPVSRRKATSLREAGWF